VYRMQAKLRKSEAAAAALAAAVQSGDAAATAAAAAAASSVEDEDVESEGSGPGWGGEDDQDEAEQESRRRVAEEAAERDPAIRAKIDADPHHLRRSLSESLYLIVRKPRAEHEWGFPQGAWEEADGASLRATADRELREECGSDLHVYSMGNAPIGFMQYKFSPEFKKKAGGQDGAKARNATDPSAALHSARVQARLIDCALMVRVVCVCGVFAGVLPSLSVFGG
jgi:hypothetical protein